MEGQESQLVLRLIAMAVEAGANRRAARMLPGAARSLNGLAEQSSRQVRALAAEIVKGAATSSDGAAPSPHPDRRSSG